MLILFFFFRNEKRELNDIRFDFKPGQGTVHVVDGIISKILFLLLLFFSEVVAADFG